MTKSKKEMKIQMTEEDLLWVKRTAERCGVSPSELLRAALFDYIFHMDVSDISAIANRVYKEGMAS